MIKEGTTKQLADNAMLEYNLLPLFHIEGMDEVEIFVYGKWPIQNAEHVLARVRHLLRP